jgi:predicted kinase
VAARAEPLVVWINGAFGVGKTAVADQIVGLLPGAIVFDPEPHGDLLRRALPAGEQPDDFQDLQAWRELTRVVVASLARTRAGVVVVPMTLVDDTYFDEIVGRLRREGVRLLHLSLVASPQVVTARLRARPRNNDWALDRVERCASALAGERFAEHLDASDATPREIAARIRGLVDSRGDERS